MDDWNILRFLRGCKFSLERTKQKLDMYYTCKTAVPEWFTNRDVDDPKMKQLLEMGVLLPLPTHSNEGQTVILGRFGLYDPHKISFADIMRLCILIIDLLAYEDESVMVNGLVLICDVKGSTFAHMAAFTPTQAKKSAVFVHEGEDEKKIADARQRPDLPAGTSAHQCAAQGVRGGVWLRGGHHQGLGGSRPEAKSLAEGG